MFQVGDNVERIKDSFAGMNVGDIGTIMEIRPDGVSVMLKEFCTTSEIWHSLKSLEFVSKDWD